MSDESDCRNLNTAPRVQHHICEHDGCAKGWGFAKAKQAPHWFCFEHRAEGEKFCESRCPAIAYPQILRF
ncbi:MAG: hypothetical protein EOR72_28735 [Mesorhizobium sp.]|nr:hypothetical protein [Mesorhizobium sp.]RWK29333.1 MAG: hypothetical protein EOR40_27260 [Mesorhizobium sp.]RWM08162.1 MAG: hypothetical protein EOR72_28735 [Mesorhizobium sp.]TIP06252.1 MAG: hypothetical protein E5X72_02825 [Mesorhizobium sp.]TIP20168.1 MAG: hypothetical protein E5X66_06105 [Mesorhizobium sp.]TJV84457.1 MAG: hypothetical protein E5X45_09230 [Mesorhizobium sp.]